MPRHAHRRRRAIAGPRRGVMDAGFDGSGKCQAAGIGNGLGIRLGRQRRKPEHCDCQCR
ncbi:MAG: hypothetical protein U5K38_17250 [Woeseiaceae bacterium]|nr:hypothetical protein [Woeseiaceae bacterium]